MSGESKTLTLTLEEGLAAVRAKAKADGPAYKVTEVRFMPFAHYPWWVEMAYGDVKVYTDWPPALSFALGVPVVARDEAAELRAALERIADWPDGGNLYGQANIKRFAADTLRRLAGGEGEQ